MEPLILYILLFVLVGSVVGVLSGFFGLGGGAVIVPALMFFLSATKLIPRTELMHVVISTSLAVMIFTALASSFKHSRRGNINFGVYKKIGPLVIVGSIVGTSMTSIFPTIVLEYFFLLF